MKTKLPISIFYVKNKRNEIKRSSKILGQASDKKLKSLSKDLMFRAQSGESEHDLIVEAFALVREASHRVLGLRHYDVQVEAGINLAFNCVVEMATGEGKTLTALLPLFLRALYGKSARLATANDYLAFRDRKEMGPVFEFLGLTVGVIQKEMDETQRLENYHCDVTYGTLAEFGFDYLRDRMRDRIRNTLPRDIQKRLGPSVSGAYYYLLVDEADSVMIDDASTPLVIGTEADSEPACRVRMYRWAAQSAIRIREGDHYHYIEHRKKVELTAAGRTWTRQRAIADQVADLPIVDLYEFLERAIKVNREYQGGKNYLLDGSDVAIIDENTGRLAVGRSWQDGIHQAIQARESLPITPPTATAASLTVQSFVLSFPVRAGMTGTALNSKKEFKKVYKLKTVKIPTRLPSKRKQFGTRIFDTAEEKLIAILDSLVKHHNEGRPVLIGARSLTSSETLSAMLVRAGIPHKVLNARNEALEASIVSRAGVVGAVTISTSMGGRGTDIKVEPPVKERGGLHVLMVELNDSARIDRQLIGRCARQGDAGSFQLFLSADDALFDIKQNTKWLQKMIRRVPFRSVRQLLFRLAQYQVAARKTSDRLAMLHSERERLRELRFSGMDPVLDVVN